MTRINSLEELKKIAEYDDMKNWAECFIMFNGGIRSSKRIVFYPDTNTFDVHNEIDDSYQEELTEEQLKSETFIIEAIEKSAFFKYDF
jgi:hypothetical protein